MDAVSAGEEEMVDLSALSAVFCVYAAAGIRRSVFFPQRDGDCRRFICHIDYSRALEK